jgi:fumarylacetoacetase
MPSWIVSANAPDCDFPLQNLLFGIFSRPGEEQRCCTAIGDFVVDLAVLEREGIVDAGAARVRSAQPERIHGAGPGCLGLCP